MGLLDFFKKGEEKKVTPPPPPKPVIPTATTPQVNITTPKPVAETAQEYTIKSGDSLSKIAKQFYGDAQKWNKIYEANKDVIKDPNLIHPNQKIKIPKL